jgi:hemerythrin-like domain-containing protein
MLPACGISKEKLGVLSIIFGVPEMKAIQELRNEHEGIKRMLRILDAVAGRVEDGDRTVHKDVDSIMEFLSVFADKCHHGKEEDHLFPALEKAGVPREGGPIGVMLAEHVQGRGFISDMKAGIEGGKDVNKFASAAGGYIDLLTRHIDKENNVLFPMAEGRIDEAEDARLMAAFEKLERERIGPGRHEEFHGLLKRLKDVYLK